jgi:hypothetical protein
MFVLRVHYCVHLLPEVIFFANIILGDYTNRDDQNPYQPV